MRLCNISCHHTPCKARKFTDLRNRKAINQNSGYLLMSSYLANGKYKEAEILGVNSYIQGNYYKQYAYQFHKIIDYYYKENQIEDLFSFKIKDEYYLSLVYNMITENIKELSEAKRILTEYFSFKNYPPTFFLEDLRSFHVKLLAFYDLSVAQEEFKKNYDFYLTLRNDEDDYSSQYFSYINNLLDTDLLPFIMENFQVYTENVSHTKRQTIYKNIIFKDIEINKRTREYIDENLNQIYESFVYMKSCTYTPDNDESRTTFYYFVNEDYQQFLKELSKQMMTLNRLDDYIYYYDKSQLVENIGPGKIQFLPDSIEKRVYYWIQNKKEEADFHFSGKAIEASRHKIYEPEDVYYETILGIANLNQTSLVYELLDHATSIEFRKVGAKRKKEAILSEIYLKLKNYDKAYDYALIGYWQNYLPLRDMNFEYRDTDRLKKLTNCYLQNAWEIHSHIRYLLLILLE